MGSSDIIRGITTALEDAGITYMLVGSCACNFHGAGVAAQDVDLVISATQHQTLTFLGLLSTTSYHFNVEAAIAASDNRSRFKISDMTRGLKIDLIFLPPSPFHQQSFTRRKLVEIEQVTLFAAAPEDVIISKLALVKANGSVHKVDDITGILKTQPCPVDLVYIEKWIQELGLAAEWALARRASGNI